MESALAAIAGTEQLVLLIDEAIHYIEPMMVLWDGHPSRVLPGFCALGFCGPEVPVLLGWIPRHILESNFSKY